MYMERYKHKNSNRPYYPKRGNVGGRYRKKSSNIHPLMFVKKASENTQAPYVAINSISDLPLNKVLKSNVLARGYTKLTAIQDKAILPIIEGKDLVGIANTGTGKTAAFLLPLINKVINRSCEKVLIVTPTRELAAQIQDEFRIFSSNTKVYSTLCIGGSSLENQARRLSKQPSFVVGTPGRIKDLQKRRLLKLDQFTNVVLDEVDRMLDMGFIHDIKHIISFLPKNRQSLFFSATLPQTTKAIMQDFLTNPVTVSVVTDTTPQNVDQNIVSTRGKDKLEILHDLLIKEEFKKVLVFGRTKWGVNKLEISLIQRGFKAAAIHGNKSQGQRIKALNMLKTDQIQVLLATDVASRGLDIKNITHVINFDLPETYDDYIHRIGRTGRAGKKGVALTFVD